MRGSTNGMRGQSRRDSCDAQSVNTVAVSMATQSWASPDLRQMAPLDLGLGLIETVVRLGTVDRRPVGSLGVRGTKLSSVVGPHQTEVRCLPETSPSPA